MFCPKCGSNQDDTLRFCKLCGANLFAVRQVVDSREPEESFDWSKTWVAEMFRSSEENKRRKLEMERRLGITPEIKRITEIKTGVIISSVGASLAILLYVLMQGLVLGGEVSATEREILSRLWIVGIIPFFVGLAFVINGLFVSKKLVKLAKRSALADKSGNEIPTTSHSLPPVNADEFIPSSFSVTEEPTKHFQNRAQK